MAIKVRSVKVPLDNKLVTDSTIKNADNLLDTSNRLGISRDGLLALEIGIGKSTSSDSSTDSHAVTRSTGNSSTVDSGKGASCNMLITMFNSRKVIL